MPIVTANRRTLVSAIALAALSASLTPALADVHASNARGAAAAPKPAEPEKRWPTDAVLRSGMDDIAAVLRGDWEAVSQARLPGPAYRELADKVQARLAATIKNCRLSPASDRAFHEIVMDIQRAADLMRSPKVDLQRAGALGLAQALRNYGRYFEHPGWAPPR